MELILEYPGKVHLAKSDDGIYLNFIFYLKMLLVLSYLRYKKNLPVKVRLDLDMEILETTMIIGIGIDFVRTERIERIIGQHGERFINRVFTSGEREYCSSKTTKHESYAARFSAKEAMFKALGRAWAACRFTGVEVVSDSRGKPEIVLRSSAKMIAEELGVNSIFLSMTHDSGISAAVVILEKG